MGLNTWTTIRDHWQWLTERGLDFESVEVTASTDDVLPKDMKALQPYRATRDGMARLMCAYVDEVDEQKAFNAVASCLPEDRRPPKVVTRDGSAAWSRHIVRRDDGGHRCYIHAQWEA